MTHIKKKLSSFLCVTAMICAMFPASAFAADTAVTIDGKQADLDLSGVTNQDGTYDFSKLDFSDTDTFANGADDAYLLTVDDETYLVGDTSMERWVGSWESWENYIFPDENKAEQYPYLDTVWDIAYESYMATFAAAGIDMSAQMPNTEALKNYWKTIATTKGVDRLEVTGDDDKGYTLTWLDEAGKTLASDTYTMTGKLLKGFEGAAAYVFTADNLDADSDYKYFISMDPGMEGDETEPIAAHYHFQFGSDLDAMLLKGQLYNSTDYGTNETTGRPISSNLANSSWYATMINADASDVAKYNVILGMHQADKWSSLPIDPTSKFTDISATDWYYDGVYYVLNEDLMVGVSDTEFAPNATLTRAELAQILYNKAGKPEVSSMSTFSDVPATAWYAKAVAWAQQNNVVSGVGNNQFAPNQTITRESIAVMLYNDAGSPEVTGTIAGFADAASVSDWAQDAMLWATQNKVLNGAQQADGTLLLNAASGATRAETAALLANYDNR